MNKRLQKPTPYRINFKNKMFFKMTTPRDVVALAARFEVFKVPGGKVCPLRCGYRNRWIESPVPHVHLGHYTRDAWDTAGELDLAARHKLIKQAVAGETQAQ